MQFAWVLWDWEWFCYTQFHCFTGAYLEPPYNQLKNNYSLFPYLHCRNMNKDTSCWRCYRWFDWCLIPVAQIGFPHTATLGRLPGTHVFRNIRQYTEASTIPGILIVRVDAPFYFASVHVSAPHQVSFKRFRFHPDHCISSPFDCGWRTSSIVFLMFLKNQNLCKHIKMHQTCLNFFHHTLFK